MTTFTLNVDDFGRGNADALFARLGDHVVSVTDTVRTDTHRGVTRTITGFRIQVRAGFDGMRNTVAHGHACNAGFIAWCD